MFAALHQRIQSDIDLPVIGFHGGLPGNEHIVEIYGTFDLYSDAGIELEIRDRP